MLIIVTYLSDQAEENDYRKPARSGAVDQAEGKGKEEGRSCPPAQIGYVQALRRGERRRSAPDAAARVVAQSSAATARITAPDAAARVDAASASLHEQLPSQLPSQLSLQLSSQPVVQSSLHPYLQS